jgi:hypothetical protein
VVLLSENFNFQMDALSYLSPGYVVGLVVLFAGVVLPFAYYVVTKGGFRTFQKDNQ